MRKLYIVRNSYLRPNLQSPKYPLATIFIKKMVYLKLLIFSPFHWISWEESVHHPFLLYQSYCLNFLLNFEEKATIGKQVLTDNVYMNVYMRKALV